jgi:hypothetical protein
MWATVRNVGVFFTTIKGWAYLMSLIPTMATFVSGVLEQLPWPYRITLTTVTLAAGLLIVAASLWIWERAAILITNRRERQRIMISLSNLGDNVNALDLPTAAAIWAGTGEISNIERHVYFRSLKNAVDNGKISASNLNKAGEVNAKTKADFESLKDYWRNKGVIN